MTPEPAVPRNRVRALWRRVAVQLVLAAVAGVLAALAGLLVSSWLAGSTSVWQQPSVFPLALWLLATTVVTVWLWQLLRRAARWDQRSAAAEIEGRLNLPRWTVLAAVEPGLDRAGTSSSLLELHSSRVSGQLRGKRLKELGGDFARAARLYATTAIVVSMAAISGCAAVWYSDRAAAADAWAAVLHPVRHLKAPPLPGLRLSALEDRVRRGRDLPVRVLAPRRDSVRLVWQPRGMIASHRWYAVSAGSALASVPRVEGPTLVWATAADGASSDTIAVEPVDPLLLLDVQVTLRYPPHTGRDREVLSTPLPAMTVPQGTRAMVSGVTTLALDSVALRNVVGGLIPFQISEGRRFSSSFRVIPGAWGWHVVGAQGERLEGAVDSLYFTTVADSAPQVAIVFPGVDTVMATSMTQPLMVEVGDDYGLSRVELVSWRISAWGEEQPPESTPIPVPSDAPRASLPAMIDARGRGFLPGDTLRYYVRAYDNGPQPQMGLSREYVLRLPTLDEVRERAVAEANEVVSQVEQLAERAREHEESTQTLERSSETQQAPGVNRPRPGGESAVEFRDTEAARSALEEANELLQDAQQIQEALRELQETIESAGLNDTSVLERLRELESLYDRILTPELEEAIEKLRQALSELDQEAIREAIQQLAEGSLDFRERVEQSLELLRRAAIEAEFEALETQAEELSEEHDRLADAMAEAGASPMDSAGAELGNRAENLSRRAESLAEMVERFVEELNRAQEIEAAEQAMRAEQAAADAARSDQRAASQISQGNRGARRSAQQAASQMQQAASALQQGRQQMQEAWRQQVVQALERAQVEAMELARRQQDLNERLGSRDAGERAQVRSEEVAIKRGADQIEQQLSNAGRSSLLVDEKVNEAAASVGEALEKLLGQLNDGTRSGRGDPQYGQQAAEAMNELAYQLMQAADQAAMAQSGTGVQEALQELAQLAEQQGELNAQSGGITPSSLSEMVLQQLRQLAGQQRAIGEELTELQQSMGPRSQVLGQLDALGREAEELAQQLERGRLDEEIIERQNRLFQRLLDAGRTLEQDEYERERRAERPENVEILRPGELPPELLQGARFPLPSEEVLQRYPPAYRRLILEYFDRLNGREASGGS